MEMEAWEVLRIDCPPGGLGQRVHIHTHTPTHTCSLQIEIRVSCEKKHSIEELVKQNDVFRII